MMKNEDDAVKTTLQWRPGPAQGREIPGEMRECDIVVATLLSDETWDISSGEWDEDWLDKDNIDWWLPAHEIDLPKVELRDCNHG